MSIGERYEILDTVVLRVQPAAFCVLPSSAMPLTPRQRRDLLRVERLRDADSITAAIIEVLRGNSDADLLEIEMVLRAAASTAFVVATGDGFRIVIGVQNCLAALAAAGMSAETNRAKLAARR